MLTVRARVSSRHLKAHDEQVQPQVSTSCRRLRGYDNHLLQQSTHQAHLPTTSPSLLTKNFEKFHLMSLCSSKQTTMEPSLAYTKRSSCHPPIRSKGGSSAAAAKDEYHRLRHTTTALDWQGEWMQNVSPDQVAGGLVWLRTVSMERR